LNPNIIICCGTFDCIRESIEQAFFDNQTYAIAGLGYGSRIYPKKYYYTKNKIAMDCYHLAHQALVQLPQNNEPCKGKAWCQFVLDAYNKWNAI
jgi:hypothetical protein